MKPHKRNHNGSNPRDNKDSRDWVQIMKELVEVEFRSGRTGYFWNPHNLCLPPDTWVITQVERGFDIARIINSAVVEPALLDEHKNLRNQCVARLATDSDMEKLEVVVENEQEAARRFNEMVVKYPFEMKLIRTVYQFDGNKLTFFFTADGRVDFREFVRELASFFRTRIELHQTTGRDVAKQLGGIGMCGKEYCCANFLKRFSQITIKMAKDQNLSGNLSKISGPCGRLLCCLDFEETFYQESAREFPQIGEVVLYKNNRMYVYKNDFYNQRIHLGSDDNGTEIVSLEEFGKLKKV